MRPIRSFSLVWALLVLPSAYAELAEAAPVRGRPAPEGERRTDDDLPEAAPELVHLEASGLTAAAVGKKASQNSFKAKAMEASLREAAAHVDEAWLGFLPRLSATARYTRLSVFTQAKLLDLGNGFNPVFSAQPPYEPGRDPQPLDVNRAGVANAQDYRLKVVPDQY
ncbi:MAG: hypothetical protein EOP08_09580, partial [Proteobacteria bacterium]